MNTVVCSAASGPHVALLDLAEPTYRAYADRHGFDVFCARHMELDRPPSWYKLILIPELLRVYQRVVWVDADAVFLRTEPDIANSAEPHRPLWMVLHRVEGVRDPLPNCGVMVCYRDRRVLDLFEAAWDLAQFTHHPWWEQAAILHLLGWRIDPPGGFAHRGEPTEWTDMVGWLDTEWNSMPHDPHPDPVVRHYSGMGFEERLRLMREDVGVVTA